MISRSSVSQIPPTQTPLVASIHRLEEVSKECFLYTFIEHQSFSAAGEAFKIIDAFLCVLACTDLKLFNIQCSCMPVFYMKT